MQVLHSNIYPRLSSGMSIAAPRYRDTIWEPYQDALQALTQLRLQLQEVHPSGKFKYRFKLKEFREQHHHRTLEDIFDLRKQADLPTSVLHRCRPVMGSLAGRPVSLGLV